jgi:hypothetical protein
MYSIAQANISIPPSFSVDYLASVGAAAETSLSRTLQVKEGEGNLVDLFVRTAVIFGLGSLIFAALKRRFEKRFRHR